MEPEEALHFHILRRKKDGVEDWIDRSVEKIGAVPTLNDVLLPAMKEVGDKFGAGELILPFVLQSAEVMKRAVAQLEKYLDKHRGLHEGHGRAGDRVRRRARHRQVARQHDPDQQRLHGRRPRQAGPDLRRSSTPPRSTTPPRSASARCSCRRRSRCRCASRSCTQQGLEFPVLIGGAAINRDFGLRALYPGGRDSEDVYEPGVFYCKDAFEGLNKMDQLVDGEAREALVAKTREAAREAAREGARARGAADRRRRPFARPRAPTCRSRRRRSGACARSTCRSTRSTTTSTRTCSSSCTGAGAA